jgi:hypothetical protein
MSNISSTVFCLIRDAGSVDPGTSVVLAGAVDFTVSLVFVPALAEKFQPVPAAEEDLAVSPVFVSADLESEEVAEEPNANPPEAVEDFTVSAVAKENPVEALLFSVDLLVSAEPNENPAEAALEESVELVELFALEFEPNENPVDDGAAVDELVV